MPPHYSLRTRLLYMPNLLRNSHDCTAPIIRPLRKSRPDSKPGTLNDFHRPPRQNLASFWRFYPRVFFFFGARQKLPLPLCPGLPASLLCAGLSTPHALRPQVSLPKPHNRTPWELILLRP
jgi:hypothetical protein